MAWSKNSPDKYKKRQAILSAILAALLVLVGLLAFLWLTKADEAQEAPPPQETVQENITNEPEEVTSEEQEQDFNATLLQATLDQWLLSVGGKASVVMMDVSGEILASNLPDEIYFAASLYKTFVAHEGYLMVDRGEVDPEEIYLNGQSRAECLDLMIRESDSPCGEKMLADIGGSNLNQIISEYGIENTSLTSITTTASDSAIILAMISRGELLSAESQKAYLDSMKTQPDIYRRGLPSGFSENVAVYNKVGWNELVEWHDAAIVEFSDDRQLVVAVLTQNVGSRNVAELGRLIEESVTQ